MDALAADTATKTLDTLKSLPTWLLVGLTVSFGAIWLLPPLFQALPDPLRPALPLALLVVTVLTACNVASLLIVWMSERRRHSIEQDRERLHKLYAPLETLFLRVHITVSTGRAAPRLRHRVENAWNEFGSYRRPLRRLTRAWQALFDRQESSSAEIEYGAHFPLDTITELVRENVRYARPELLHLISRAHRSQYDEPDRALLTDAEFELFHHIDSEHQRLSRRVG